MADCLDASCVVLRAPASTARRLDGGSGADPCHVGPCQAGPYRAGLDALAAGLAEAAVPLLRSAAAIGDGGAWAELNLGLALLQLGRLVEAAPPLERAAVALPACAEPHVRLGTIAGLRNEAERAAAHFRIALALDPAHVPTLAALAALEEDAGRLEEAAALLSRARLADPAEPELNHSLARLALRRNDPSGARLAAEAVLAQRPNHAGAARLLAEALLVLLGEPAAALPLIAARAEADPFAAGWPLAAAHLHAAAGRPAAALAELRIAELLAPGEPEILAEFGRALANAGRGDEAEAVLRAAITARPAELDLRNRLATVLWKTHRIGDMLAVLDVAVAEFGPHPTLQMNRALALNAQGQQDAALAAADAAVAGSGRGIAALVNRVSVLPYHPRHGHAAALLSAGRDIAGRLDTQPLEVTGRAGMPPRRSRDPGRRLRVGLLSGGLGQHPVGWLTLAGLEALPEADFELAAYVLRPREDALAARFRARCAIWHEMPEATDAALAARIAADDVDLLIDLGGYGESGRPFVLHHRPAPVQLKWVGAQFGTMGLDCVDWMLTDRWETPPDHAHFYIERLLPLRDGYVCYAPPAYAPAVGPLPALTGGGITFGCSNNLAKLTPRVLETWASILDAVPSARLVLRTHALGEAATRDAMRARCLEAGLPQDHLALEGGLPHRDLLASYGAIDIALDPFPYTGGLTVCEALWMGVPTVSLAGDSFCGRHALSHLSNVGLPEWVVETPEAYVALAIARARDVPGLARLRAGLRRQVQASPLCDAPRFGASLATALRRAWVETPSNRAG